MRKQKIPLNSNVEKNAEHMIYYNPHKTPTFKCHCGEKFHSAHELADHYSLSHGMY